jgi:CubicO group peptidase (beta-lactamase class C family)
MTVQAIDDVLSAAQASGVAPGLVAAARLPGGGSHLRAVGQRGVEDPAPMTADTLFWIASMTKAVTSVGVLQLAEQGKLSLDQPAADFVPSLAASPILDGFGPDGAPKLRPAKAPITIRQLLTHTSGHGYPFLSDDLARCAEHGNLGLEDSLKLPRLFEAGERWNYGVGIDFAGQVVEAITGKGLDAYLKEAVFDVLGMANSTFAPSPAQAGRLAAVHARLPDGSLAPAPFAPAPPPNPMLGGGGLYSTAPDYLAFLDALLNGGAGPGGRILRTETLRWLIENQVGDIACGVMKTSNPVLALDHEPMPGVSKRWTLGFLTNLEPGPDGRSAGSLAWAGLSNSYYWLDPRKKVAGVILMQLLPFADPRAIATYAAFERAVYAA